MLHQCTGPPKGGEPAGGAQQTASPKLGLQGVPKMALRYSNARNKLLEVDFLRGIPVHIVFAGLHDYLAYTPDTWVG